MPLNRSQAARYVVLALIVLIAISSISVGEYLGLFDVSVLRAYHASLKLFFQENPAATYAAFSALLIFFVSFSIPGTLICMLFAGSVFDFHVAVAIVTVCRTIGGAIAFLLTRYVGREYIQRRLGGKARTLDKGIERDGWVYLLVLRLAPVLPDSVINPGMGLTGIRLQIFIIISALGMIPWVILYVLAGRQLMATSGEQWISPLWLVALTVLAGLILLVKKLRDAKATPPNQLNP